MQGGVRHRLPGAVDRSDQRLLLRRLQLPARQRQIRLGNPLLQQRHQPRGEAFRLRHRIAVLHQQTQALARQHQQRQRIVGIAFVTDSVAAQRPFTAQQSVVVRIVFHHQQRIEQRARPGQMLDLPQPQIVVLQQFNLPVLQFGQLFRQRTVMLQTNPHRQRVAEQANVFLDPFYLAKAAGNRRAEHHVLMAATAGQLQRPNALHHGIERQPAFAAQGQQAPFLGRRQRHFQLLHAIVLRFTEQQRRAHILQRLTPEAARSFSIPRGQAAHDIGVVRTQRRQCLLAFTQCQHQIVEHHRRRPAVDDQVVRVKEQRVAFAIAVFDPQRMQHRARLIKQIALQLFLFQLIQRLHFLLFGQRRQPVAVQRPMAFLRYQLQRFALEVESGGQLRMAADHRIQRLLELMFVQFAAEAQARQRVIAAALLRRLRMEQQAVLQRQQRQRRGQRPALPLPGAHRLIVGARLGDLGRHQRRRRAIGMPFGKFAQRTHRLFDAAVQLRNVALAENPLQPAPVDRQAGAVAPLLDKDIHFQAIRQRLLRILRHGESVAEAGLAALRRPVSLILAETSEVVEQDLRRIALRQRRQFVALWMQITQLAITDAAIGHRSRRPFHRAHGLIVLSVMQFDAQRILRRQPADGAGKIEAVVQFGAAVRLQRETQRSGLETLAASLSQRAQHDLFNLGAVSLRQCAEQRGGQPAVEQRAFFRYVARAIVQRIQRSPPQTRCAVRQHPPPERQLGFPAFSVGS